MSIRYINKQLQNKRILITGGKGFLGRYLVPALRQSCKEVHLYQKDVRIINTFAKRYDIVCHLAGFTKIDSNTSVDLLFDVNVNGTLAVMQYCYKTGARCILASSSAVYNPTSDNRLLRETQCIKPVTLYGISKMLAEDICRYHAESFGISVIALRIFNMYGSGQKVPFLIPDIMHQLARNKPVVLKTPRLVRDFVSVIDVVRAFILSCTYEHPGFIALNVGTGRGLSIYELVKKIALHMGVKPQINSENFKRVKKDFVVADLQNTLKVINWRPEISIDKGIRLLLNKNISD